MKYIAQELWYGKVYQSLEIEESERRQKTKRLVDLSNKNLSNLINEIGAKNLQKEVKDFGTHISFPKLEVLVQGEKVSCKIRINPCWSYPSREDIRHSSKIFVILGVDSEQQTGEPIRKFFDSLQNKAEELERKIKEILTEVTKEERDSVYEIPIKNVGIHISSNLEGLLVMIAKKLEKL